MIELIDRAAAAVKLYAECCIDCIREEASCDGCVIRNVVKLINDVPVAERRPAPGDKVWRFRVNGIERSYRRDRMVNRYIPDKGQLIYSLKNGKGVVIVSEICQSDNRRFTDCYCASLEDALAVIDKYCPGYKPEIRDEVSFE